MRFGGTAMTQHPVYLKMDDALQHPRINFRISRSQLAVFHSVGHDPGVQLSEYSEFTLHPLHQGLIVPHRNLPPVIDENVEEITVSGEKIYINVQNGADGIDGPLTGFKTGLYLGIYLIHPGFKGGNEQIFLIGKIIVQTSLAEFRQFCNFIHRGFLVAVFGEHPGCRFNDELPVKLFFFFFSCEFFCHFNLLVIY